MINFVKKYFTCKYFVVIINVVVTIQSHIDL